MEKLESGASTPLPLEQHLEKVETAIAAAMDDPKGPAAAAAGGKGEDAFIDAILTSPIQSASMFVSVADQLGGSDNPLMGGKKRNKQSHFLGESGYSGQKPTPTPLIPLSYAEKKQAAKRANRAAAQVNKKGPGAARGTSVFASERLALASMSLTGDSMTGQKRRPMKGAKVDIAMAQAMGLTGLVKELNFTLKTMKGVNRYDGNSGAHRLQQDLREGKASAENLVQNNPVMATKVLAPK